MIGPEQGHPRARRRHRRADHGLDDGHLLRATPATRSPASSPASRCSLGGSLGRASATSRGVVHAALAALRRSASRRRARPWPCRASARSARCAAQFLHDAGCAWSRSPTQYGRRVRAPAGSTSPALRAHVDDDRHVVGFPAPTPIGNDELLELDVDLLVPAALEGVLHARQRARIRARFVVEGANGPTTPEADAILAERGVARRARHPGQRRRRRRVLLRVGAGQPGVLVERGRGRGPARATSWSSACARGRRHWPRARGLPLRTAAHRLAVGRVAEAAPAARALPVNRHRRRGPHHVPSWRTPRPCNPSPGRRTGEVDDAAPRGRPCRDGSRRLGRHPARRGPRSCAGLRPDGAGHRPAGRADRAENGKSLADARAEVAYAAEFFRWFAEEAVRTGGEYGEAPAGGTRTRRDAPAGRASPRSSRRGTSRRPW